MAQAQGGSGRVAKATVQTARKFVGGKVVAGPQDNLLTLAQQAGTTPEALAKLNGIQAITPGQTLRLPPSGMPTNYSNLAAFSANGPIARTDIRQMQAAGTVSPAAPAPNFFQTLSNMLTGNTGVQGGEQLGISGSNTVFNSGASKGAGLQMPVNPEGGGHGVPPGTMGSWANSGGGQQGFYETGLGTGSAPDVYGVNSGNGITGAGASSTIGGRNYSQLAAQQLPPATQQPDQYSAYNRARRTSEDYSPNGIGRQMVYDQIANGAPPKTMPNSIVQNATPQDQLELMNLYDFDKKSGQWVLKKSVSTAGGPRQNETAQDFYKRTGNTQGKGRWWLHSGSAEGGSAPAPDIGTATLEAQQYMTGPTNELKWRL